MLLRLLLLISLCCVPSAHGGGLDDYYLARFGEGGRRVAQSAAVSHDAEPLEKCYTPVMKGLRRDWELLHPETRKTLAKYLARPTLENEATFTSSSGRFRIHYAVTGPDAPPLTDSDGDKIPDWVVTVADVFETVYQQEVVGMGYRPPPTIGNAPYDVYLKNIGGGTPSYLGLTDTDAPYSGNSYTSYMTIENDFKEFSRYTPLDYLKTTVAHEFHHAIQFGYTYWFDVWYGEATSTWIEDEVFDSVNQVYDYLPQYLANLDLPLDTPVSVSTGGGYGRWIFNRYLAETVRPDFIRSFWETLAVRPSNGRDIPAVPLLDELLGGRLDQYVLGLGRRFVRRDWTTHQNEVSLIHPVVPKSPVNGITYPNAPYSYTVYDTTAMTVDLSNRPADVTAEFLTDDQGEGRLLLCNTGTGWKTTDIPSPSSNSSGSACFIATAAYGTPWHRDIDTLRSFRDRVLLATPAGRRVVGIYYRLSPPVADLISTSPPLRQFVRGVIMLLVSLINHPILLVFLLAAAIVVQYNHVKTHSLDKKIQSN